MLNLSIRWQPLEILYSFEKKSLKDEDFKVKQVLRYGIKDVVVDEVPIPLVEPYHVLIRPAYSLISSGTESASIHSEGAIHTLIEQPSHLSKIWKALKEHGPVRTIEEVRAKFHEYSVLGYAGAGVIVEKHPNVKDLELGDRVAYGGEGTGHGEYVLAGRNYVAKIPECLSFATACFTTLGSIALNAVRTAKIELGDVVLVEGLGLVGQLVSQLARLQGGVVIGTDLRHERLQLAEQLGAHHVVQADAASHVVRTVTNGRGADCVIIAAAAKSPKPSQQALELCRERGRIVVVGAVDLNFPWEQMYLKEIRVFMARAYGAGCYDAAYEHGGRDYPIPYVRWTANRNMEEFLRIAALGQVQIQPLISHEFPLEQAAQAYETILDHASGSLAVVLRYQDEDQGKPETAKTASLHRKVLIRPATVSRKSVREGTSDLNVAVVGAGNLARWAHLPILQKSSGINLRAIVSSSGSRGRHYALRFGAEYCTTSYEEVLNDPQIDIVIIVSRNARHCPQALEALRAGKHVFVEKPMAVTEAECCELSQEVQRSGRQLTVGFNRRFAPVYLEMKKHLVRRTGPAVINCRVNSPGISGTYWMADPAIGGALVGEGCHFVDLMYWLLESEPTLVSAFSLPKATVEPIGENNIACSFLFADGSVANLTYCTMGNLSGGGEQLEAFAPGISAVSENFKRLKVIAGARTSQNFWFPKKGYSAQMRSFLDAIRNGTPCDPSVDDGVRATVCCLRILQSATKLEPCPIDLQSVVQACASAA